MTVRLGIVDGSMFILYWKIAVKRYRKHIAIVMEGETNNEEGYKAPEGFKEVSKKRSDIINITPSSELWLIQCPLHHALELDDEQEISLKLDADGLLGSFEGSSGKSYDVVSLTKQNSNATVFLSSAGETKIAGKISRHVSLVHYPEPSELQKQNEDKQKQRSGKSFTSSSYHMSTPTQSVRPRSSKPTSTHSSKRKSSLSEAKEPPTSKKRKHREEHTRSSGQSTLDSGRGHSAGLSSGSLQHSSERKSKKNKV